MKDRRYYVIGSVLVIVLAIALYFGIRRPHIVTIRDEYGIEIRNRGDLRAYIFRVEIFWYWESQVGFLTDIPPVRQYVPPTGQRRQLDIPDIPAPDRVLGGRPTCFMRIVIHYQIPGVPLFRYRTVAYFEYDRKAKTWSMIDTMPARYRSLGNMGRGDVEMIKIGEEMR